PPRRAGASFRPARGVRPALEVALRRPPALLLRQPLLLRTHGPPGLPMAHANAAPRARSPRVAPPVLCSPLLEGPALAARRGRVRMEPAAAPELKSSDPAAVQNRASTLGKFRAIQKLTP